jgi:NAD(P)-dependent dehydrogenase (short-subunit alcohol dehydrogenase family)
LIVNWSEKNIPNQSGRRIVVTGTGGLGYEAARALTQSGAEVIIAGRNPSKGDDAVGRIRTLVSNAKVRFEQLDLASLGSVHAFASRLASEGCPIDVLVNNAGVAIVTERRLTEDGFELQIGTNHLGHFALTMRLMPLLLKASAPRVVSLSSNMHKRGMINFDDLQLSRSYGPARSYGQSKLATIMFALELDSRAKERGLNLVSVAAHPGIARTDLMNNGPVGQPVLQAVSHLIERLLGQSAAAGTLPLLRAATDPGVQGGEYFGPNGFFGELRGPPVVVDTSLKARDQVARRRLWEVSAELTGVDFAET